MTEPFSQLWILDCYIVCCTNPLQTLLVHQAAIQEMNIIFACELDFVGVRRLEDPHHEAILQCFDPVIDLEGFLSLIDFWIVILQTGIFHLHLIQIYMPIIIFNSERWSNGRWWPDRKSAQSTHQNAKNEWRFTSSWPNNTINACNHANCSRKKCKKNARNSVRKFTTNMCKFSNLATKTTHKN